MKICFFTENYYKGGLDTFLINLSNAWPVGEDELVLLCNNGHPGLETIRNNTSSVIVRPYDFFFTKIFAAYLGSGSRVARWRLRFFNVLFRLLEYPVLFPWYVLSLRQKFRHSDFDRLMVVNGGYPASLLCRCAAVAWKLSGKERRAIFNFHNLAVKAKGIAVFFENIIDRAVIRSSGVFISVSDACLSTIYERPSFRGCKKLHFIHNGIADPAFGGMPVNNHTAAPDSERYCLMLGTYEPRKGHRFLLQAFASVIKEYPDVKLKIYGFGTLQEKEQVMNAIKDFSLTHNVSLNDFTKNTTQLISNADILLIPSQSFESFGLTAIEAMALGTPVVATNVGGLPEIIENGYNGVICSKDEPQEFARVIIRILSSPELSGILGGKGRQTFLRRYTASQMALQYEKIIKNI